MRAILGLALVAVLLAVGDGRRRPLFVGDPPPVIEQMIYEMNLAAGKENKTEVNLPDLDSGFHFLYRLKAGNGKVGKLNTLALRGDRQFFNETDVTDETTVYNLDLTLGLQEMYIAEDVSYRFLVVGSSGRLTLSLDGEAARIIFTITTVGSKQCSVAVKSVNIEDFGKIQVDLEPKGLFHPINWVVKHTVQFVANYLGVFKGSISKQLEEIVQKHVADSDLQTRLCKPFVF